MCYIFVFLYFIICLKESDIFFRNFVSQGKGGGYCDKSYVPPRYCSCFVMRKMSLSAWASQLIRFLALACANFCFLLKNNERVF